MDKMIIGREIFLALSIAVFMGMLVVPVTASLYMEQLDQKDLMGSDYNKVEGLTASQCSQQCLGESYCQAATYVKPGTLNGPTSKSACWLKSSQPAGNANLNTISWVKKDTTKLYAYSCAFEPIIPDFSANPVQGPAPLTVTFTDTSTGSRSWNWDFNGDKTFDSYIKNPQYTYNNPGNYTVNLTVGGGDCMGFKSTVRDKYIKVIAQLGSIDVSSVPPGAKVYVDLVYKGVTGETPFKVDKVSAGTHSVLVQLNGYANQTKPVTVTANTASKVSVTLAAIEGAACDDKDKCTTNDIMKNGECMGTPKDCDDKNPATEDTCKSATGACVSTPKKEGAVCDDGNPCTVNDVMKGGACTMGTYLTCNDNNATTADACDPKSGCVYTPLKPMSVIFNTLSPTVNAGEPANLVITVVADGIPVADAKVAWSAAPLGAALDPESTTTNSTGMAVSTFSASREGSYTITATVTKEGLQTGNRTLPAMVKSGLGLGTLLPIILVGLLIAIIAIIVLFLLTRNRLQLIVKQTSVPADGRSAVPVKVQFTSGLGSLKNQSVDRDVSLTATSGTIKPVIVSRGKAFTETTLTASRDVGKVKVTAQYGNMQAEAMVSFTLEGGLIEISAEPKELPADGKSAATVTLKLKDKGNIPVSFMDEKTARISTTLGTIPGSVKIPPHATQVTTSVVSGTVSGIATITGVVDQLKGEAQVKIGALAERYCQRCGMKVTMDAVICPNCRRSPTIPDTDTKQCPFCKEELPRSATYCNRCGRNQAQQTVTTPQRQETPRAAEVTPKKKFCGNCGKEHTSGKKFCSNCGAKIN